MSSTTVLGVTPGRRPIGLAELRNAHGWAPSIWRRLLIHHGYDEHWFWDESDESGLLTMWKTIEELPEWEQVPLVLTFDTGVIPCMAFLSAADELDEFDRRLPAPEGHVNHVPAVASILRSAPEVLFVGVYGTSVSDNPFDPWDEEADAPGSGIPLGEMYLLDRHRELVPHRLR